MFSSAPAAVQLTSDFRGSPVYLTRDRVLVKLWTDVDFFNWYST